MVELKDKKILLIVPQYFGYEKYIESALECRGAAVTTIIENLDLVSMWYRFIYVYFPAFKERLQLHYYCKYISKTKGDFDYVLVVRGSSLTPKIMEYLKKNVNSQCTYLMYQWDGIQNNQDVLRIVNEFDRVSSFDVDDAMRMGWKYTPLFYINTLTEHVKKQKDIDILYIGSIHSSRIKVYKLLREFAEEHNLKLYAHLYSPKLLFYKRKYVSKNQDYIEAEKTDIKFNSLTIKEVYELYERSKIVVDFTHPHQTGFTMRTIECVGNECKLVTNNQCIKDADFFNPHNILVYEGTDINIPMDFIEDSYEKNEMNIKSKYSLDGWIDSIFGEKDV